MPYPQDLASAETLKMCSEKCHSISLFSVRVDDIAIDIQCRLLAIKIGIVYDQ